MLRFRQLGRSLLLCSLMLGLSALGVLRHTHAEHLSRQHLGHHHAPVHGSHMRRASRANGRCSRGDVAHADHTVSHVAPRSKPEGDLFSLSALPRFAPPLPATAVSVPVRYAAVPVLALGSAARAPGAPRGPPSLS